jgi:linoleate 9S-lipoxygenase
MAVEDASARHGLRLMIQDYPYAEDGLEVWAAIERWVTEYVSIYYKTDDDVKSDSEVQEWWREIREIGHGDHANAHWWADMSTRAVLAETLTTLVWLTSGHHAAVNFGQYAYFGYMPNYPTMTRLLIPERGSNEYKEMLANPEAHFLRTVSTQGEATLIMATVEILAQHMGDEEYLGERKDPRWTSDPDALDALARFKSSLVDIEKHVEERIKASNYNSHRSGPTMLDYTLLMPSSGEGLTFRGIPNSISI